MIKGWYAKHKDTGKWHQIEDIKDTGISAEKKGGGNNYHLKDVGPVHQSKIADMAEKPPMEKTEYKDKLKGGRADKKKPADFDSKQLAIGIRHEREHTNSKDTAREIAMDHLSEDPEYYTKLQNIEKTEPQPRKFHIYKDGYQITAPGEEMTMKEIDQKHGIKALNNSGHLIKPAAVGKYDRIDEEADGKKELDYGKEELDKRWERIKKAMVDSDNAIMEIAGQEYNPDEDQEEQPQEGADEQETSGDDQEELDQEDGREFDQEDPGGDGDQPQDGEDMQGDEADAGSEEESEDSSEQEIIQALREAGYSEAAIAHIIHGHNVPTPSLDDTKVESEQAKIQQELEHKARMNDLAHETAQQEQGINELDKEHKQRMLDLEYETAKQEKEMELDFKRRELETKLDHMREKQQKSLQAKKVDVGKSRSQDAAQTSKKEMEGK